MAVPGNFRSLIALLGASHGTLGFSKWLGRLCQGPKSTMLVTWIMGNLPTLIMHGIHDQVVPYQLGVVQYRGIRGSKLVTFENSGHGLF